jgi:hypothetical protein
VRRGVHQIRSVGRRLCGRMNEDDGIRSLCATPGDVGGHLQDHISMSPLNFAVLYMATSPPPTLVAPSKDPGLLVLPKDNTSCLLICHNMHLSCGCIADAIEGFMVGRLIFVNRRLSPSWKNQHRRLHDHDSKVLTRAFKWLMLVDRLGSEGIISHARAESGSPSIGDCPKEYSQWAGSRR